MNKPTLGPLFLIILALLGFGIYFNSLSGTFLWDDKALIEKNKYIQEPGHFARIFQEPAFAGSGNKAGRFYRPLQMASYIQDYSLWKLDVRGYHLTNVILHIFVAWTVCGLVFLLFGDRQLSFFTSLLYICHPIHTEAVSYISGRADILAALFLLTGLIFYIRYLESKKYVFFIGTLLSYSAALLSKEFSLVFPGFLLFYHICFYKKIKYRLFAAVLLLAAIYICIRFLVIHATLIESNAYLGTFWQRLPGFFAALTQYIRLLIVPFDLHMVYGIKFFHWTDLRVIFGVVGLLSVIFILIKKIGQPVVFFSAGWFLISILPVSNLYPLNAYMAEHWLYLPSLGFFVLISWGLCLLYRSGRRAPAVIILAVLTLFYSYRTVRQNEYWLDPLTFFERTSKYSKTFNIYSNLGFLYQEEGRVDEAIDSFKRALEIDPDASETYKRQQTADLYLNIGALYQKSGRVEEAKPYYRKAHELDSSILERLNLINN